MNSQVTLRASRLVTEHLEPQQQVRLQKDRSEVNTRRFAVFAVGN
jgi:hypothetical protein